MAKIIVRKVSTTIPKSETAAVRLKLLTDQKARHYVCRVAGVAVGIKENVHPQYGISYGLVGSFAKINPNGWREDAPVLWTTESLILPIKAALDNGAASVQLMADIWAIYAEKGATGFQYVLETHGETAADPLDALLGNAPAMPMLPAPEPAADTATVTASSKTKKG